MITKNIISIIGGGAVGVSLLHQLINKHTDTYSVINLEINIFEKNKNIGRGLAYSNDSHVNLLNRPAETMSAISGNISDFKHWLDSNQEWKQSYPDFDISKSNDQYLPRSLFGMYLESLLESALEMAEKNNIKVNVIHDEVVDIQKKQSVYCITSKSGNTYLSHSVILALGHTQSNNYDYMKVSNKYFNSPYPTTEVINQIPKDASVAIIGSRLSAIDAAISLDESEHMGQMAFISRNGYLPGVRPDGIYDYKLKIMNARRLREITQFSVKSLTLNEVINMVAEEASLAVGKITTINEWLHRPREVIDFLENELSKMNCHEAIAWHSVMIALNNVIELIWHKLSERDKLIFNKRYRSRWMAYRVGIPCQNAKRIHSLLQEGRLSSIRGLKAVGYDNKINKFVIKSNQDTLRFDYAINATGFCSDINHTKSLLLTNMKNSGLVKPNPFGGLDIDFDTSRVKDITGVVQKNLYVIGNLTEGAYFFTSVLELNVRHASIVSDLILNDLNYQSRNQTNSLNIIQSYARVLC